MGSGIPRTQMDVFTPSPSLQAVIDSLPLTTTAQSGDVTIIARQPQSRVVRLVMVDRGSLGDTITIRATEGGTILLQGTAGDEWVRDSNADVTRDNINTWLSHRRLANTFYYGTDRSSKEYDIHDTRRRAGGFGWQVRL